LTLENNASISRFTQSDEGAAGEIGLYAFVGRIPMKKVLS